jgi:hypothetical protein
MACGAGQAQPAPAGTVATSLSATVLGQSRTDIDHGGAFRWSGASLGVGVRRQFTPGLSAGVDARFGNEDWSFDLPTGWGSEAPWGKVLRPSLGIQVSYAPAPDLSLFIAPQVEWNYESGARAANARTYGAVFGATKAYSPTLFLGLGLGVFRQIGEMQYFPFVIVNWQINDAWRLSNPVQGGPAGGAGLELSYAFGNGWELGGGAAYRDYRFRLRSDGPTPNGIGRHSGAPVFARLRHRFGPSAHVDLYAGAVVAGKLRVLDGSGTTLQQSGYGTSPLLALSGSVRF